ncbi:MAG: hypothetical protein ACI8WB_001992 [Phenylobacterium sp.]|jgi:hypothetical protein
MKKLLLIPPLAILALMAIVFIRFTIDGQVDYQVSTDDVIIPTFDAVDIDFEHRLDETTSLPFMASAVIDIDNDGTEELFLGGGPGQQDVLFKFADGSFTQMQPSILSKTNLAEATFASVVVDFDNNGFYDLIVSRTNSVWLYLNHQGEFKGTKLDLDISADTTPISVAISDINRDGHVDLFVSGYIKKELAEGQNIFNQPGYGGTSALYLNNGDNSFSNITATAGLHYKHNTFMAIFVDIDNDRLEDLVIAHDTGQVKTWKNNGDLTFTNMPNPNSKQYSYPMGIAVSDIQNDGLVDFFFSNIGSTVPDFVGSGDLRDDQDYHSKWLMFKNTGDFGFEDVADEVKLADYEFSWGAIFEDFNLDGRDDLVVSENYIGFPPHKLSMLRLPGRFLLQTPSGEFTATGEQSNVVNYGYSISPVTADFNGDGYPDLLHANIAGKSKAFINQGGDANYLKINLPKTVESIAAKIKVQRSDGQTLYRDFVSGEGLNAEQTRTQIFGLGKHNATSVSIEYVSGKRQSRQGPFVNQTLQF